MNSSIENIEFNSQFINIFSQLSLVKQICLIISISTVIVLFIMYSKVHRKLKFMREMPGPPIHPLFGNLGVVISNSRKYSDWSQSNY